MKIIVIGSGPTGIAAVHVLRTAGVRPIVFDGGEDVDDAARARADSRESGQPSAAPPNGSPGQKAWFGSNAPYAQPRPPIIRYDDIDVRASYARGGFSRVWGATNAFAPASRSWPESIRPTDVDLAVVDEILPRSATAFAQARNALETRQILGSDASRQVAEALQRKLPAGWRVDPSQIAMREHNGAQSRCGDCTPCLGGCAFGSIWSATEVIESVGFSDEVDYRPGRLVIAVRRSDGGFAVSTRNGGVVEEEYADRVILAAGPLSTAAILLESSLVADARVSDTSTAFMGALDFAPRRVKARDHHPLSQFWAADSSGGVLAQFYPPSIENVARIVQQFPIARLLRPLLGMLAARLHPVIAYLDSADSAPVELRRVNGQTVATGETGAATRRAFRRRLAPLRFALLRSGYLVPPLTTRFTPPGTGYHIGGSLAHGDRTDELGQLPGVIGLHIVDASALPTIEVGSITPTAMANAARITRRIVEGMDA